MIRAHAAEFDFAGWNGASIALRKRGFRFVGPTTVYAWMQATGLVNDHVAGCFRRNEV